MSTEPALWAVRSAGLLGAQGLCGSTLGIFCGREWGRHLCVTSPDNSFSCSNPVELGRR